MKLYSHRTKEGHKSLELPNALWEVSVRLLQSISRFQMLAYTVDSFRVIGS
jgi:hypothetical protein